MSYLYIKRVYELDSSDKARVLVDRLWPRGESKQALALSLWAKEIAPSSKLRMRYHNGTIDFADFSKMYLSELVANPHMAEFKVWLKRSLDNSNIALCTAAKDVSASHVPILKEFLSKEFKFI